MSQLSNVTVNLNANIYFDGKVISRTIVLADGQRKTLGVMLPGEYAFTTDVAEIMTFSTGSVDVLLPNTRDWLSISAGMSFDVPGDSEFKLVVHSVSDYIGSYASA